MNNAFFPHTHDHRQQMLQACGVKHFNQLLSNIPDHLLLKKPLDLPSAASEEEVRREMAALMNGTPQLQFTGLGRYAHIRPAVIDYISGRSEFYTAYTPYQAELSQGTLQVMLEYQTMMCELTKMDVSNAGLYDGATAACEAVQMAVNINKKQRTIYLDKYILPYTRDILYSWFKHRDVAFKDLPESGKQLDDAAATLIRYPDALGKVKDISAVKYSGLLILECDPLSLGLLTPPGELHADICIGDISSLGLYMQLGGPSGGFICCRQKYIHYLPGRIAGIAKTEDGATGVVLALQAREQHIRREKARSNICTNQALMTLQAALYMASLGPSGICEAAEQSYRKAHYLARKLEKLPNMVLTAPNINSNEDFFNEFILETKMKAEELVQELLKTGIVAGIPLQHHFPGASENHLLIAVTEKHSRSDLDRLVEAIARCLKDGDQ